MQCRRSYLQNTVDMVWAVATLGTLLCPEIWRVAIHGFEQESVLHGHAMLCRGLVEILVNCRLRLPPRVVSTAHDRLSSCTKGMCRGAVVRRKACEQHVIVKSSTARYLNSFLDHENHEIYWKLAEPIRNHSSSSVTFALASPYFCRSGIPMPVQRVKPMTMASPLPQPCVSLK